MKLKIIVATAAGCVLALSVGATKADTIYTYTTDDYSTVQVFGGREHDRWLLPSYAGKWVMTV